MTPVPKGQKPGKIDKSGLAHPIQERVRSKEHRAFIAGFPCCVFGCRAKPCVAHHLLCGPEPKARSMKPGDNWCVPLCTYHHTGDDGVHRAGDELAWWHKHSRVDPRVLATFLWKISPARAMSS